jgi:hypothetical protein
MAWIINSVLIQDQRIGQCADLQESVPVSGVRLARPVKTDLGISFSEPPGAIPAGRMAWERETGAQPLSGLSGPRGIRGRTPAASAVRQLYSGAGEAGMLEGDLPWRNAGPGGRMGGLGEAVLVAETEAVLRPAQPRKLEI